MKKQPNPANTKQSARRSRDLLFYTFLVFWIVPMPILAKVADTFSLPVYMIDVAQDEFDRMVDNPTSDIVLDAILSLDYATYPITISLRGASARTLPKKSFNIKFKQEGPNGEDEINLNAEYRDTTRVRNVLAMFLTERIGQPAPHANPISLVINDQYQGIYIALEEVDDKFFEDRNMPEPDFLLKSISHGGRFIPLLHPEQFQVVYDIQEYNIDDLEEYLNREMIFQYGSPQLLASRMNTIVNAEQILTFYAIQFAIMNRDGFTKNFYLNKRRDGVYELIPWDCDATFGNHWTGTWNPDYIETIGWTTLNYNPLFSRLIEQNMNREYFNQRLHTIAEDYFPVLDSWLDDHYESMLHDALLDPFVPLDSAAFDTAWTRLHEFVEGRGLVLKDIDYFQKIGVYSYSVEESTGNDSLIFHAFTDEDAAAVYLAIGNISIPPLFSMSAAEDATDTDMEEWTVSVAYSDIDSTSAYAFFTQYPHMDRFPTPASGMYGAENFPPNMPIVPGRHFDMIQPGEVAFGPRMVSPSEQSSIISIINRGTRTINTAGLSITLGEPYKVIQLANTDSLLSGDTLFLCNRPDIEESRNSDRRIYGPYPTLSIPETDTLRIFDFQGRELDSSTEEATQISEKVGSIVINEINYHSSNDFPIGDWVELYLRDRYESIADWTLRDDNPSHEYRFTQQDSVIMAESYGYLVVAEYPELFASLLPDVPVAPTPLPFGLGNGGDMICLYNEQARLVDMVNYDDKAPWPTAPDGDGPTLELLSPDSGNANPDSWRSSLTTSPHGTPGERNSVSEDTASVDNPTADLWQIASVFPNPSGSQFRIQITSPDTGPFVLSITNVLGRQVRLLNGSCWLPGKTEILWDGMAGGRPVSSGIYLLRIIKPSQSRAYKVILLR